MIEKRKLPTFVDEQREGIFEAVNSRVELARLQKQRVVRMTAAAVFLLVVGTGLYLGTKDREADNPIAAVATMNDIEPEPPILLNSSFVEVDYLTDSELLELLDNLGQPSSLGTFGGLTVVVPKKISTAE